MNAPPSRTVVLLSRRARRNARLFFVPLVALLLAACASRPPESAVPIAMPTRYRRAWQPAAGFARMPAGSWWQIFRDSELDHLEALVPRHNQSLAAQLAVYDQARAALDVAGAAYAPTLSAGASSTRAQTSGSTAGVAVPGRSFTSDNVSASAAWTPDLWGRVRLQVQAGTATAAASAASFRFTLLSLQGSLAQSYLELRIVEAQVRLAQKTVLAYRRALQFNENTYKAGVASAAGVAQARTQWLQAQTTLTDLGVTRVQLQDAIAVLTGQSPVGFCVPAVAGALPAVPRIPPGVPIQLLQRRPDLAAASHNVEAANAQLGVAQTAWLPNLTLSAQAGSQAAQIAGLFTAPSLFWSLGPSVTELLFEGGLRRAQRASSRAIYRQTVANYRQDVLTALEQVQDNLAAQHILALEARQQDALVRAADLSLRVSENQYKAGIAPYTNVILAQNAASSARDGRLVLRNRRYSAAVALIEALGGGWGRRPAAAVPMPTQGGSP